MITILLAEDHAMFRQALRTLLEAEPDFSVVAEAGNGLEILPLVEAHRPDVLVLDLVMPGLDGLETTRRVVKAFPETKVVVLSMHTGEGYVVDALRKGASGYIVKEEGADVLVEGVRAVHQGRQFLSPSLPVNRIDTYTARAEAVVEDPYETLTGREREILQLLGEGHTGPEIADILHISPRTVGTHRNNLMAKLQLHNQAELVRYAIQRGLVILGRKAD